MKMADDKSLEKVERVVCGGATSQGKMMNKFDAKFNIQNFN